MAVVLAASVLQAEVSCSFAKRDPGLTIIFR